MSQMSQEEAIRAMHPDDDADREPRGTAPLATAATVCCAGPVIAPLVVGILGAGGAAWAAGLKPYAPWLLGASFLLLAYGFRAGYRRPAACEPTVPAGPRRWVGTTSRVVLWAATILWLVAAVANLVAFIGS